VPSPRQQTAVCGLHHIFLVLFGGLGERDVALGDRWMYMYYQKKWINLMYNKGNSEYIVIIFELYKFYKKTMKNLWGKFK